MEFGGEIAFGKASATGRNNFKVGWNKQIHVVLHNKEAMVIAD